MNLSIMKLKRKYWLKNVNTFLLHLIFWVLVIIYFAWGFGLNIDPKTSFVNALFYLPGHIIMVYSLLYFLVPRYLLNQKFLHFFLGLLVLILICSFYTIIAQLSVNNVRELQGVTLSVGRNILPFIHVGAIAASIKLLKYWYVQKKQTIEAEHQKTAAELKLLKAQLHPHFLFNTLNNLYSHTLDYSPKSPEIVLRLSSLLRFMIYESNVAKIPLKKEIELLQNYISLEQLRYGDRLDMSISIYGNIEDYQIAPLILLPFLENSFKHGTSRQIDQCWISLNLSMTDSNLEFKLVNSIDSNHNVEEIKAGGVGLQNVIRRLQLLYKNNFKIETVKMDEVFIVNLNLALEKLEDKYVEKMQLT